MAVLRKVLRVMLRTVEVIFVVLCVFIGMLFVREQRIPKFLVNHLVARATPEGVAIKVGKTTFGFTNGLRIRGIRVYDTSESRLMRMLFSANDIQIQPFSRRVTIDGAKYDRLPDSYYAPENIEKNARVEGELPEIGKFELVLTNPDILAIKADKITASVDVTKHRAEFNSIVLNWPSADNRRYSISGMCYVDLDKQEVYGEVDGFAKQSEIRPMLVAIDVPVALPYMDGFTDIPEPCKAWCGWKVDLVRNDLDLWLDLHPKMGRYNGVPMRTAEGKIHLHNYTRGTHLNYTTTVGPVIGTSVDNKPLEGSVIITGTNGYNVVDVKAKGGQPLADLLKIGGFTGDYVGQEVVGDSECDLQFRFPRAMTNNYEVLNGRGHIEIKNGQLLRMKGFKGLIDAMPSVAPAVTWFSDSTRATGDYVIENGVVSTKNTRIEGSVFVIKMDGAFDAVQNKMDFKVLVQFMGKDSLVGKVINPITWTFSKLLLEFRLTGTPDEPKWKYVSVVDKVMGVVR